MLQKKTLWATKHSFWAKNLFKGLQTKKKIKVRFQKCTCQKSSINAIEIKSIAHIKQDLPYKNAEKPQLFLKGFRDIECCPNTRTF